MTRNGLAEAKHLFSASSRPFFAPGGRDRRETRPSVLGEVFPAYPAPTGGGVFCKCLLLGWLGLETGHSVI